MHYEASWLLSYDLQLGRQVLSFFHVADHAVSACGIQLDLNATRGYAVHAEKGLVWLRHSLLTWPCIVLSKHPNRILIK